MVSGSAVHSDPDIMGGKPVFIGTRVPVKNLFEYRQGSGLEEFLRQFPTVTREQAMAVTKSEKNHGESKADGS